MKKMKLDIDVVSIGRSAEYMLEILLRVDAANVSAHTNYFSSKL